MPFVLACAADPTGKEPANAGGTARAPTMNALAITPEGCIDPQPHDTPTFAAPTVEVL